MAYALLHYTITSDAQATLLHAGINVGYAQTLVVLSPGHVEEKPVLSPADVVATLETTAAMAGAGTSIGSLFASLAAFFTLAVTPSRDRTEERVDEATWARVAALVEADGVENELTMRSVVTYGIRIGPRRGEISVESALNPSGLSRRVTAVEFCTEYSARVAQAEASKAVAEIERTRRMDENNYIGERQWATNQLGSWSGPEGSAEVLAVQIALAGSNRAALAAAVLDLTHAQEQYTRRESARICAEMEAAWAAIQAARTAWIEAHGSDYLKGLHALTLDVQPQYEKERIALEFPGWELTTTGAGDALGHRQPTECEVAHVLHTRKDHPMVEPRVYHGAGSSQVLPTLALPWTRFRIRCRLASSPFRPTP